MKRKFTWVSGYSNMSSWGANSGLAWSVVAISPIHVIARPAREARNWMIMFGAIAGLVSVLIALLLSNRITRPLKEVSAAATKLSPGEYGRDLPAGNAREVNEISTAFNSRSSNGCMESRLFPVPASGWPLFGGLLNPWEAELALNQLPTTEVAFG